MMKKMMMTRRIRIRNRTITIKVDIYNKSFLQKSNLQKITDKHAR